MTANSYYTASGQPSTGAFAASAPMRTEFTSIQDGFDLLPALTAGTAIVVNSLGTALSNTVGTLALAGNLATTGAFNTTIVQGATTTITLPIVSGTLATLAGTETLTNKTMVAPSLGTPTVLVGTNITGTAASLTAGNVTTNANLTGVITSVGNSTSITVQTGTGTIFVVQTSPTLITPVLGVATATTINKVTLTAPASSATLTLGDGATLSLTAAKVFTVSNTLTLTATDGSTLAIGTGGTLTSAAFTTIGTSGATLPLLNGTNTWSGVQVLQGATTTLGVQSTTRGTLVLGNTASGAKAVTLQSSNSTSAAYTLTLPVDDGTSGQVLSTNGSGLLSWVGRGADYNLIEAKVLGTQATVEFTTNIDYEDLLVAVNGVVGDTVGQNLLMAISINGGSAYGTAQIIGGASSVTTSARYYAISLTGAKTGFIVFNGPESGSTTSFGINSSAGSSATVQGSFTVGSQVNAVQFSVSSSHNFTGGTITLYGR